METREDKRKYIRFCFVWKRNIGIGRNSPLHLVKIFTILSLLVDNIRGFITNGK